MTPDEHLARAEALLTVADDLFTQGQKTDDWPQQIRLTEAATCAAAIAHARIDLASELRAVAAVEEWRPLLAPDLGALAPVTPMRKAPAHRRTGARNQHPEGDQPS